MPARARLLSCPRPPTLRRSTSAAERSPCLAAGRSIASPSGRICACGSTAAPSTWGRRAPRPALSRRTRSGGGGRSWSTPAQRRVRREPRRKRVASRPIISSAAPHFTGLGFDACTAPSRALDVGLGGLALPGDRRLHRRRQPRLLAAEPDRRAGCAEQVAAGWHLIPTYVGLQAPTTSCSSCAKLSASPPPPRRGPKRRPTRSPRRRRSAIGAGQPDLLRHGELRADLERHQRDAHLPLRLDLPPARARLQLRRLQQRRLGHRRPRRPVRQHLPAARRALVRQLERPRSAASDPYVPAGAWSRPPRSTSTTAATTRPTAG